MHANSALLFARYARPHLVEGGVLLEIGPDRSPSTYRLQVLDLDLDWQTAELDDGLMPAPERYRPPMKTTYRMRSEYDIPVADATFDVVLAGNVIEHVRKIWAWMPELARVVKPGGKVVVLNPISWPYHEAPRDCWRIYPDGMRALCEDAGLEVLLCTFATLEDAPSRRRYPGVGYDSIAPPGTAGRLKELVKWLVGWPVPTAVDLITIAQRPG